MNLKSNQTAGAEASESHDQQSSSLLGRYAKKLNHENILRLQKNIKHVDETLRKQVQERPLVMMGAGLAFGMFLGTRLGLWATRTALKAGWASVKGSFATSAGEAMREVLPTAKA